MISNESSLISWELKINIYEFDIIEHSLRVTGDMHIGGVIFQLVEQLNNIRNDWSDFALWWPDKNQWLNKTKYTLDQYGVQADANLHFTRMHKAIKVKLPDQQVIELNADFSINVFNVVKNMCKDFGIRHFEELSVLNYVDIMQENNKLAQTTSQLKSKNNKTTTMSNSKSTAVLNTSNSSRNLNSALNGKSSKNVTSTLIKDNSSVLLISKNNGNKENSNNNGSLSSATSTLNNSSSNNSNGNNDQVSKLMRHRSLSLSIDGGNGSFYGNYDPQSLAISPIISTQEYLTRNDVKYKCLADKARINSRWLDSSKSLMEQKIKENDLIQLRFKYYAFFDLNLKSDLIRINQIYEQAKWSILSDEIDCTEQELIHFAALQLQIQLQTKCLTFKTMSIQNEMPLDYQTTTLDRTTSSSSSSSCSNTTNQLVNNGQRNLLNKTNGCNQLKSTNSMDEHFGSNNHNIVDSIQDEDDVDTALSKLEKSLDLINNDNSNVTNNGIHLNQINDDKLKDSDNKKSTVNDRNHRNNNNNHNHNNSQVMIVQKEQQEEDDSVELSEELFLMKNQKYTFKKFKSYYFTLNDTHYLSYYKSKEESLNGKPIDKINLRCCELVPDVNMASRKFGIILKVPSSDGMNELNLRCPNEESYASWMSACKLASKSKSINDSNYLNEVKSILNLLQMQQKKPINISNLKLLNQLNNGASTSTADDLNGFKNSKTNNSTTISSFFSLSDNAEVQATNLLPSRIIKKHKLKQLNDRILEAYSTISDLDLFESKWRYIKAWQALPNYGMTHFIVKVKGSRLKEEIICVTSNRLLRMSPDGETIKSWRFNTMKSWNVNWEIKQFEIIFEDEHLIFMCLNCDAKILHEYIGCYIYLSLRIKEKSETFSDEMFFKLTEKR